MISLITATVDPVAGSVKALMETLGFDTAYEMSHPQAYYPPNTLTVVISRCPKIKNGPYKAVIAAALICPDYTSLVYLRVLDTPADRWAYICARSSSTSEQPGRFAFGQQCCITDKELSGEQLVAAFTLAG